MVVELSIVNHVLVDVVLALVKCQYWRYSEWVIFLVLRHSFDSPDKELFIVLRPLLIRMSEFKFPVETPSALG
jgi:hypothetical protein